MVKQYSLKDISVITLKHISVDDDLREFIEKVNFNFDNILSVLDNRFYDEVSRNVLKLIASGKYLQYLTNKPSDSVQWIGKPGRTGKPGIGKDGKDGHSIYVSKTEIPKDGIADNVKYKEGDVVLDKLGYIFVITKKDDKLYYTLQFKLSAGSGGQPGSSGQTVSNIITTEDKYAINNDIADHWILYDADNITYGSNNIVLATADDAIAQLYRLTIGSEKSINDSNGTLNLVNIPVFRSAAADETFSPQILLKYRKNYQSALLPDVSAHIRYFDVYDSTLENVEYQQLDMWTSANNGVSVQSFTNKPKDNAVILNARKTRFVGNRDVVPTIFSKPELIIRVHEQIGNQPTEDDDYDLSIINQSYVAIYTNENLFVNSTKEININSNNVVIYAQNIGLNGNINVDGVLHTDFIKTNSKFGILIGEKLHVGNESLSLDHNYELRANKISSKTNIVITTPNVEISNSLSIGGKLKVNEILPNSNQAITISKVDIKSNSTILGNTIYHAGNLNLLTIPFVAQQYNATSAGYLIDGKKIVYTASNILTVGNSTLNSVDVVSKNGLTVNGDAVATNTTIKNIIKVLGEKADKSDLILNVKDISGLPIGISIGQNGSFLSYQSLGFPTIDSQNYSNHVLASNYKWIEIQPIPLLKDISTSIEKGVLGFLDNNGLQYLSLEQLLDANSHKVADDNHVQVVNVDSNGKLRITNVFKITDPVNIKEDLVLVYDWVNKHTIWQKYNPLPTGNKQPGRVLVLNENNKPEWGNDYMHYRFFWNTKTNKLDRVDPSRIDWDRWINMNGFSDLRNKVYDNYIEPTYPENEFQYTNYIGNLNGQFKNFDLTEALSIEEINYIKNVSPLSAESINNRFGMSAKNYFTKGSNPASLRYIVSVIGNIVTVYFWKPYNSLSKEQSYRINGHGHSQNNITQAIEDVCYSTKMNLPNYLADYDNHGIMFGPYGSINGYDYNKNIFELPTSSNRHLNLYLNCIPFNEWFKFNAISDIKQDFPNEIAKKIHKKLLNREFIHKNRVVTLGLEIDDFEASYIYSAGTINRFYFKNFGTLNQISWILSNPISKEHYNFEKLHWDIGY